MLEINKFPSGREGGTVNELLYKDLLQIKVGIKYMPFKLF